MLLNKMFMTEQDVAKLVKSVVKSSFPHVAGNAGSISNNTWLQKRQGAGAFVASPQAASAFVARSGGNQRIFTCGYSLCGGSHVATD